MAFDLGALLNRDTFNSAQLSFDGVEQLVHIRGLLWLGLGSSDEQLAIMSGKSRRAVR